MSLHCQYEPEHQCSWQKSVSSFLKAFGGTGAGACYIPDQLTSWCPCGKIIKVVKCSFHDVMEVWTDTHVGKLCCPFVHVCNVSGQECVCVCVCKTNQSSVSEGKVFLCIPITLCGDLLTSTTKLNLNFLCAYSLITIWPSYFLAQKHYSDDPDMDCTTCYCWPDRPLSIFMG